ncbi:MAG: hypothetical protein AB8B55_01745 [Mariniblastus sp.]
MFKISNFLLLVIVGILVQSGCNTGPSSADILKEKFERMKAESKIFEDLLKVVVDEATATKTLPKLETALEAMLAAGKELEKASETTSRNTITLKQQTKEFRGNQAERVNKEVARLKIIPVVPDILEPIFSRMGSKYKPVTSAL